MLTDLHYIREHPECGKAMSHNEKEKFVARCLSKAVPEGFGSRAMSQLAESDEVVLHYGVNISYHYLSIVTIPIIIVII